MKSTIYYVWILNCLSWVGGLSELPEMVTVRYAESESADNNTIKRSRQIISEGFGETLDNHLQRPIE